MRLQYKIIVTILFLLSCSYIYYLKVQIHTIRKNSIPIQTIESSFSNTLGSFNNKKNNPKTAEYRNQLIISNSNDLAQFYGICITLFSKEDRNFFELTYKVEDYYFFMRDLAYKVENKEPLTDYENEKYQQIYANMNLLKRNISEQRRNHGTFNDLSKLYSNIKPRWIDVRFN
ncbi:hypothetical protein J5Y03_08945 [Bacillus sp. RG28]|uniref:Uncharacterized protein n=1 Tax=Gottfriedia endophytica TaxID=2820819 RepID=A0A940NMJ1_9BACI|nr:hypothetical protein [Gottfriedia endophytica]MBP0725316.1 hypothetical protein [Gottfriedia endophytica]